MYKSETYFKQYCHKNQMRKKKQGYGRYRSEDTGRDAGRMSALFHRLFAPQTAADAGICGAGKRPGRGGKRTDAERLHTQNDFRRRGIR